MKGSKSVNVKMNLKLYKDIKSYALKVVSDYRKYY